jgi:toxin ParE1/3/4
VARFRFSRRAEADLFNIGIYTFRTWGEAQTDRYIRQLENCCQLIADNPALGRPCDEIRPGCVGWSRASMWCFTGRTLAAF